jgi:hypothetical protein
MMRKALCALLALAISLCPVLVQAQAAVVAVKDPEVAKGIKAVEDGDYDAAIFVLDAATRRLAADPRNPDLPQAYLHLGIAYVGKGAEAAAKAKFREALKQMRDLALSADKYPPKVINVFEAARDEVSREAAPAAAAAPAAPAAPGPRPPAQPKKEGGGGKTLLIVGGLAAAGAGVALAAGGGGSDSGGNSGGTGNLQTRTFANEVVVFGGGRDFVVDARGSGTLTARCTWVQDGVLLGMYIVSLANPGVVLKDAGQTGSKELTLTQAVTAGSYRISVTNSSGAGPVVDTTFTLTVTLP